MTAAGARRRAIWQIALLSIALFVLIVISASSIYLLDKARDDAAKVAHTLEVENQLSLAQLQMRRAESAERGYLLTQQESFLDDFQKSAPLIMPLLQKLAVLTSDNDVQKQALAEMIPQTTSRVAELTRVVELTRAGKIDEALAVVRDGEGRQRMNDIRELATRMRNEEGRLFALRTAAAEKSQAQAAIVTTSGSGLVIALAGLSMFLVRRSSRERDEAEQKLRDYNLNLEATVNERTADLREANDEIQRFAYIVSHDLRSPLVNIMGFTGELDELREEIFSRIARYSRLAANAPAPSLNDNAAGDAPELNADDKQLSQEFSEALGFIKSSIGKMDRLISAILNLTREGRRTFQPEKIDTRELIENIVSTVAHQASEANAQIRIEPLPNIVSDRLAMEQIFSNLIDNALKYLKPDEAGDIRVRAKTRMGFAVFEVIDNGRGIDPKDHQRIFDLFRRAGLQDRQGQGIGLAHVRALVRRMGGTISVTSELGKGSTFSVTLPIQWNLGHQGKEA